MEGYSQHSDETVAWKWLDLGLKKAGRQALRGPEGGGEIGI
jgi:hypothetical protein